MPTHPEITLQAYFRLQSDAHPPSSNALHIVWNRWRRVSRRTGAANVRFTVDEPLGPSASALFDLRFGSALDLNIQIWRSLSSLDFTPSVCDYLCPKITSFAADLAARHSGRPNSSMTIFARVNLIEQFSVDHIRRPLTSNPPRQPPPASFLNETFILGTAAAAEGWGGAGDGEAAEDGNKGVSDSAIEMLRRCKFTWSRREAENCSVCLDTLSDGKEIIPLPCDHIYHESCIITWLKKNGSCPLCRQEIQR